MLACIFLPKPCFKFQSGIQSCNNNKGKEQEKKKRGGKLTRLFQKAVSCQVCLIDNLVSEPWEPSPGMGEVRAGLRVEVGGCC